MTGLIVVEETAALDGRDADTAARVASWVASGLRYRCRLYPLAATPARGWRR